VNAVPGAAPHAFRPGVRGAPGAAAEVRDHLLQSKIAAIEEGDLDGLTQLLVEDVVLRGDGGTNAPALKQPLSGAARVAAFLLASPRLVDASSRTLQMLNGQRALVLFGPRGPTLAVLITRAGDRIDRIFAISNPDKPSWSSRAKSLDEPT
jgi:RNA polymerase sigma-70 factor, ECF subfamily